MFEREPDPSFPRNRSRFDLSIELSRMTWSEFENLCEVILRRCHEPNELLGLNQPGCKGSDGVDFVALREDGNIAYQVKTESNVNNYKFVAWVNEFLKGRWSRNTTEFVIITSRRPSPALFEFYVTQKQIIRERHGIDATLLDRGWLDERLCDFPHIAGRFFGADVQLWYEDRVMMARAVKEAESKSSFRRFEVADDSARCEDVGFYVSVNLPTPNTPAATALIMLWQPGAYDAMITLGNDDLLESFEESDWHDGFPFHVAPFKDGDYLQIGNARVHVPRSTTEGLADVVRFIRDAWHKAIRVFDERKESVGYQHLPAHHAVKIGSIDPQMWCAVLAFANAHTHKSGDGPLNIFNSHHAFLEIFTSKTPSMRHGHHAILQTHPIIDLHSAHGRQNVDLLWKGPSDLLNPSGTWSRESWWPVHMTARWFEEELLPAVWAWHKRDRRNRWEKLRRIPHEVPEFVPMNWFYSTRAPLLSEQKPTDRAGLASMLEGAQRHYSLRAGVHPAGLARALDVSLLRLLECADLDHWGYLRSKGDLDGTTPEEMIADLRGRIGQPYGTVDNFGLEWRLRTFGEICRKSSGYINASDIESVTRAMAPITIEADRHNERLAHRVKPPNVFPK